MLETDERAALGRAAAGRYAIGAILREVRATAPR
jgi:hypothetical protein